MVWVYYLLLLMAMGASVCVILFGVPGSWALIGFALIYAWITHFHFLGLDTLIFLLALAAISEIVEIMAAGVAAKAAGGSSRASLGAIGGGFVGGIIATFFIPIPIVGTLIGVVAGAFVGSLILEQSLNSDPGHLLRVGVAAAKGRLFGTLLKLIFAVVMLLIAGLMAFPWRR
jgi:uncharacterized protein YqgC (DUF456 family)